MKSSLLHLPRLRRAIGRQTIWNTTWIAALVGLEVFGRWSSSDATDLAGIALFLTLVLATWREHSRRPMSVVQRLIGLCERPLRSLASMRFETGIDLRGDPPMPRALPRILPVVVGTVAVSAALIATRAGAFPTEAREVLRSISGALYLVLLAALWGTLIVGTVTGIALPVFLAREAIRHSLRWSGRRSREMRALATLLYLGLLATAAATLPAWIPLALLVAGLVAATVLSLVALEPRLDVVWRADQEGARPFAMAWTAQAMAQAWLFAGLAIALVLASRGDRLTGLGSETTAITGALGHVFAWAATGVFSVLLLDLALAVWVARRRNPATRLAARVRFVNEVPEDEREAAKQALEDAGLRVAFESDEPGRTDVELRFCSLEEMFIEVEREWPLRVTASDLTQATLHTRIRRRDEIVRRRRLLRGLARLIKAQPTRPLRRGTGTWIAPHLWFITRMSRDAEEEDEILSGPPYHPTLPLESRSHLHEVLEAVEIDILFVEDGVGFRRLQRVLRMLFEYYDLFGGQRRAEERQFVGIPGVRVIIHDYNLEQPFDTGAYPEPDYEDLGRARVLHVFRDRGGETSDEPTPTDADLKPVPAWSGSL